MSSSIKYLPIPPRVWSRVQNPCSADTYDPTADYARADYERQMLLKGNILQYKKNSSNLTKKQRYTQIAKGMWTNRTKTWATQSDTYTNPNMTSLLRVNSTILDPSNNAFSSRPNPFGCPTTTIQDGGNLVCNVVVDPCTQEVVKRTQSQQLCNPTTDSDVPGQIQDLCWNDGTQTWYPRQRYVMPTSGTKWPEGYKGFVSAITPAAPVLTLVSINTDSVTLSWTVINNDCIPISSFNIYDNGVLFQVVPYPSLTTTINNLDNCTTNVFYITSVSNTTMSEPSNTVEAYINILYGPTITLIETTCSDGITLTWVPPSNPCSEILSYTIYQDEVPTYYPLSSETSYTINSGLNNCTTYDFYMTATYVGGESLPSNYATTNQEPCPPTIADTNITNTTVRINLTPPPLSTCNIINYTVYQSTDNTNFTSIGTITSPNLYLDVTGLTRDTTYYFKAKSNGLTFSSDFSTTIQVTTANVPDSPTITFDPCYKQITLNWTDSDPTITSYNIYKNSDSAINVPNTTFTYIFTGLTNGTLYSFNVKAVNANGESTNTSTDVTLQATSYYFSGGSGNLIGSNYVITFESSGTLQYINCSIPINNASVLIVGGGGGGGGSHMQTGGAPEYEGGGGGGGGEVYNVSPITINNSTINVTVGNGGSGGAFENNGLPGDLSKIIINSTTYQANPGQGGEKGKGVNGGDGGDGGDGGGGTNGGDGGYGQNTGSNGYNSVYYDSTTEKYSGGGGGGSLLFGGDGGDGKGGIGAGNPQTNPQPNGKSGVAFGGGGGGGGSIPNLSPSGTGGNGRQGVVIFTIPN